ncbi:hypothetical protein FU775_00170 [Campylobacter jejuni]|uniref:Uncharacterized protein n=1 Tax=Campylobacter jejuni TaxID=197 RepID=A0A5Y9BS07_CAMJU|nr:hypothetical protein [Campylobacter jejuni]EDO6575938.1 hypothetical protein [Campylobacter coli]NWL60751.1 hypothetical protein [Campylobacter jejuni subsp. jejuni]EAJ7446983.1 hypothetical protein [Campylobacter jejuni]EAK0365832.1 hypothetical protein [Campylobacter jejuni]
MPIFMICSTLLAVIVVAYYILKYNLIFVFFFQILSCLFLLFISQEHLYQKLQAESIQAFKCFT